MWWEQVPWKRGGVSSGKREGQSRWREQRIEAAGMLSQPGVDYKEGWCPGRTR